MQDSGGGVFDGLLYVNFAWGKVGGHFGLKFGLDYGEDGWGVSWLGGGEDLRDGDRGGG